MSRIRFRVVPPVDRSSDPARVVGSLPALGDWDPARGLPLAWKPPYLEAEFEAETGTHFEYKIVRESWEAEAVDAYGHVPSNSSHEVWLDSTLHTTIADWKDRYRGRLTHERIHSRCLAASRELLVWLPQGYSSEPSKRFPLIVLHDGANVFDPLTSAISGVDLAADEWVNTLSAQGVMPEAIVVGICHPESFSEENHSMRDFDLSPELGGAGYAHFVANELVPYLDSHYRTLARPAARILGGVSLGALNSLYTALKHPGVFGKFLCLSTSFEDISQSLPADAGQLRALAAEPALPDGVRIYLDHGDHGLDECYDPYHAELGSLLRQKGWKDEQEFVIRKIPGGTHDELSWRVRLGDGLRFLAG